VPDETDKRMIEPLFAILCARPIKHLSSGTTDQGPKNRATWGMSEPQVQRSLPIRPELRLPMGDQNRVRGLRSSIAKKTRESGDLSVTLACPALLHVTTNKSHNTSSQVA
jgi:hypothetical protein